MASRERFSADEKASSAIAGMTGGEPAISRTIAIESGS
jgi:hypothetical protein